MNVLVDINNSVQNTIAGISTIIFSNLNNELSFDDIIELVKKDYAELNVRATFSNDDIYEALLLLYSLGKIDINSKGEIFKL